MGLLGISALGTSEQCSPSCLARTSRNLPTPLRPHPFQATHTPAKTSCGSARTLLAARISALSARSPSSARLVSAMASKRAPTAKSLEQHWALFVVRLRRVKGWNWLGLLLVYHCLGSFGLNE